MVNTAIVAGIGDKWIDCLSLDETERAYDESCGSGGSCGSSGCGCRVSGKPFRAALPKNIKVKVGDTVEIATAPAKVLIGSLTVLGLPILGAVAAWILADRLAPLMAEGLKAAIAAAGLVLIAGLTVLLGGRNRNERLPEIVSITG